QRPGLHAADGVAMRSEAPGGNPTRYYGKYRGTVLENIDPQQIGRIIVTVPDVLGLTPSTWAMPCVPASSVFVVPPIGSPGRAACEQGDPDYPIWTGGFWGLMSDVPASALAPAPIPPGQNIVVQTTGQNLMMVSDAPASPDTGGIVLKSSNGATI